MKQYDNIQKYQQELAGWIKSCWVAYNCLCIVLVYPETIKRKA